MRRHTEGEEISTRQQKEEEQHETEQQQAGEKPWYTICAFLIKLGVVCLALWFIFTFIFGIRQMQGESMYPRLRDGDLLLYYRLKQDYNIDDVVVCKADGQIRVSRIVAQGGDVVNVNSDGELLVNGVLKAEEIFYPTEADAAGITYPYTVAEGSYFLLCDYRTISIDSRTYGAVPESDIYGKVITILRRRGI